MNYYFEAYAGLFSALVPFVTGLARFRKTEERFLPFLLLVGLAFLTELSSFLVVESGFPNLAILNVYLLAEALLITWQFRRWGLFGAEKRHRWWYAALQAGFAGWWLYESFVLSRISVVNSYFILFSSFVIVWMSMNVLTEQSVFGPGRLWRNSVFLVCLGFVLYFTGALLMEVCWMYGLQRSARFRHVPVVVMACINLLTNLLFAYAILWIPTKFRYLRPW